MVTHSQTEEVKFFGMHMCHGAGGRRVESLWKATAENGSMERILASPVGSVIALPLNRCGAQINQG